MSVLDFCEFQYRWSHCGRFLIIMIVTFFFGTIICIYTLPDAQVVSS